MGPSAPRRRRLACLRHHLFHRRSLLDAPAQRLPAYRPLHAPRRSPLLHISRFRHHPAILHLSHGSPRQRTRRLLHLLRKPDRDRRCSHRKARISPRPRQHPKVRRGAAPPRTSLLPHNRNDPLSRVHMGHSISLCRDSADSHSIFRPKNPVPQNRSGINSEGSPKIGEPSLFDFQLPTPCQPIAAAHTAESRRAGSTESPAAYRFSPLQKTPSSFHPQKSQQPSGSCHSQTCYRACS
jgi:hypothetical protein